jgi:hypothetical protein
MILNIEIITLYLIDFTIMFLASYVLFISFNIFKKWDFSSTKTSQYNLEKKAYLISVIIFFIILIKIILLPYFVFIVDKLSNIMPGAMCGAGVINANIYGNWLLILKIFNIFICGFWLILNRLDLQSKTLPYMRKKVFLYFIIFIGLLTEIILNSIYFQNLSFQTPVSCCSAIFSNSNSVDIISIDIKYLLILFGLLFLLSIISNIFNKNIISIFSNTIFMFLAINVIIEFYSPYVYELPTHKCPFCLFQKEYFYIGYIFFSTLFLGTFLSIYESILNLFFTQQTKKIKKYSLIFMILFFIILNFYPIKYYFINGVLL